MELLGALEAEKLTKGKWKQYCGTPCMYPFVLILTTFSIYYNTELWLILRLSPQWCWMIRVYDPWGQICLGKLFSRLERRVA